MTKQRMLLCDPPPASNADVPRGGSFDRDVLIADDETSFAVYAFDGCPFRRADAAGEEARW